MFGVTTSVFSPFRLRPAPRIRHNVEATTLVIYCVDARFAEVHLDYCNRKLGLGMCNRHWQAVPVLGGATAFAHYDTYSVNFKAIVGVLSTMRTQFPTFKHIIVIGHEGCHFANAAHRNDPLPSPKFCWAREDCRRVALAFKNRDAMGCPIGAAIGDFEGDARVIFTGIKPGTKDVPVFEDFTSAL